jgi:hypothetical protein
MTVTANTIITRVRTQLIDERPTQRWSDDELLRWLSDGQRTMVAMDPSLGVIVDSQQLVPGTQQQLPEGGFLLMDIQLNMGHDGQTPGRVITVVSRENLDRTDPNWHASRRSDVTLHYIYDPKQPRIYYVYPPSTGVGFVNLARAHVPPDFVTLADPLTVPDLYQTGLFDYVMFRAHQKDSDYAAGDQKAQGYLVLFQMFMQGTTASVLDESANKQMQATDLSDKGAAA